MEPINGDTKIARIIKANPGALDAIVSIDPKLNKFKNPLLRRALTGRTTLAMASKISGHPISDFFVKLKSLGLEVEEEKTTVMAKKPLPAFIDTLKEDQKIELDVRETLASGKDPLNLILDKVKSIQTGQALKVINTFEPIPLIKMLEKQGFDVYTDFISADLVETWFYKKNEKEPVEAEPKTNTGSEWDEKVESFKDNLVTTDVRQLEMPQPMHTILSELEKLPEDSALYVYHKRIPVFLLPELADRGFEYRIHEESPGQVRLLIYRY